MESKGYEVKLWDQRKDEIFCYKIPFNSCYPVGGQRPNKSVAVRRAREAHGDDLTVLSVTEWS